MLGVLTYTSPGAGLPHNWCLRGNCEFVHRIIAPPQASTLASRQPASKASNSDTLSVDMLALCSPPVSCMLRSINQKHSNGERAAVRCTVREVGTGCLAGQELPCPALQGRSFISFPQTACNILLLQAGDNHVRPLVTAAAAGTPQPEGVCWNAYVSRDWM